MFNSKINILTVVIALIVGTEGYQLYKTVNLVDRAENFISKEKNDLLLSQLEYEVMSKNIIKDNKHDKKPSPTDIENGKIFYVEKVVQSPDSKISDYSYASLALFELLYSDKFLNIKQNFDNKNLFDVDDNQLSANDLKYKKILMLDDTLDEKYSEALKNYRNGEFKQIILDYNRTFGVMSSRYDLTFSALHQNFDTIGDEYKMRSFLISPDYFDEIVEHFKKKKTLDKSDYYSIINKSKT